ncbi:hypothetical protein [Hespellia stercorisuis]|uniref:Uncharacterized protein n=1 Tax=Hespellia stercorisuis DSM 15480 TaxID=1121950 RepID=A0A1M6MWD6_9FIRM|nr:hypothetical protein [Hespellia stercorisuis]SHJ87808.1 hypothetical protein SAMN02745243_01629 [Hespellia stercorisuis DSM 15480]
MNVGALLDYVEGELDAQVVGYMQEYAIPASLMDKVLDGIQSHVRQIKSEEYAQELTQMTLNAAVQQGTETAGTETAGPETPAPAPVPAPVQQTSPEVHTEVDKIEDFKDKMGVKKNADI